MNPFLFVLSVLVISAFCTGLVRFYAIKHSILDIPNNRSSHSAPTPRGGGLAIVLSFYLALVYLYFNGQVGFDLYIALIGSGILVAFIGFWDDHRHISARYRIVVHCAAAVWALFWLHGFPRIPVSGVSGGIEWLGFFAGVLFLVWFLNLFNFMDGIDGIAGLEAIFILLSAGILVEFNEGSHGFVLILIALAAACFGFIFWNWPPAKIFMGDVGSGFLGLMLGILAISKPLERDLSLWSWFILFGVFWVDATLTLIRRIIRGERWYEPHSMHAYQIASRLLGSHKRVTLSIMLINVAWLFPFAAIASLWPNTGMVCLMVSYTPLAGLVFRLNKADT